MGEMARRVEDRIRDWIASGKVRPGMRLPSERALVSELKVGRTNYSTGANEVDGRGSGSSRAWPGLFRQTSPRQLHDLSKGVLWRTKISSADSVHNLGLNPSVVNHVRSVCSAMVIMAGRNSSFGRSARTSIVSRCGRLLVRTSNVTAFSSSTRCSVPRARFPRRALSSV